MGGEQGAAGEVFGAAVYYLATMAGASCPGTTAAGYPLPGATPGAAEPSGRSLVTGFPGTAARLAQGLYEGRRTAIDRMVGECADLGGQDFAKLITAGWMPAGIALGISVAGLHDDLVTTSSGPWGTGNAEVPAYTGLMTRVRQDARDRLAQSVRALGADGVVVSAMTQGPTHRQPPSAPCQSSRYGVT